MAWWLWVLFGFLLLGLELVTSGLHIAFFGFGAIAVGALVALGLGGPLWMQLLLFTAISITSLLLFRKPLLRSFRLDATGEKIDTLAGETAVAVEEIAAGAIGKAELRGTAWTARNIGETPLLRGDRCLVEHVQGLTIHIRSEKR
ncbi:MAG TPA: NfeD family protein [Thermoanaerobaculia bacterium]|nr:NfeD family protein [Thermoanaerobaculia bacterium]